CGRLLPCALPPGELPDGLLPGANEFKKTAATITIPRRAMITTADPGGIPLIVGTMNHGAFKDSGGSTPRGGTSPFDRYRVRMTPGAQKWARPDLDWRPSGYQPDAPTRLSYGPVGSRKLVKRLKRSPSGRRNHRFERVRGPIHSVNQSSEALGGHHPCANNGAETLIIITPNRTDWDDMEALEAIKSVKSVSKYKPDPVPEQKVQAVMN